MREDAALETIIASKGSTASSLLPRFVCAAPTPARKQPKYWSPITRDIYILEVHVGERTPATSTHVLQQKTLDGRALSNCTALAAALWSLEPLPLRTTWRLDHPLGNDQ